MRHLCDSNVFVSLVMSGHLHHPIILRWFEELPLGDTAVFCRMTQNSFLRLLTTDEFMRPYTLTNGKATSTYRSLLKDVRFEFAAEPPGLEENWLASGSVSRMSPKLWMDAYLACFAELAGMRFVTFDKAFRQFTKLDLLVLEH
jgi:uncharacterized protein